MRKVKDPDDNHRTLKVWFAIIIGCLAFSSAIMFWNPGATGFIAYDAGPNPEFNPNFVDSGEASSHLATTSLFVGVMIVLQVGAYFMVSNFYNHLE